MSPKTNRKRRRPVHPVTIHIANRLKSRRIDLGISQQQIAKHLGISFQQVQKYESADNRISCADLWQASRLLNVTPAYFFKGYNEEVSDKITVHEKPPSSWGKLYKLYAALPPADRKLLFQLTKTLFNRDSDTSCV